MSDRAWRHAIVCILVLCAAFTLPSPTLAQSGTSATNRPTRPRSLYEDLQLFSGVLNQIRVNHPDSVDAHRLVMAAIRGMVHESDPYSGVIPGARFSPEKEKAFRDGKIYPVGIQFTFADGAPRVHSVTPGSAAARADVLPATS